MNLFIFFFFKVLHLAKTGKETCLRFVLYETRQALTARFYLRFFVLDMNYEGRFYCNTTPFLKQQLVSVLITGMKMQILPSLHP